MPAAPFVHLHRVTYAECTLGNHVYHSQMHNQHGVPVLAAASHHACTGLTDKPRRLPAELLAALLPRLAPAPAAPSPAGVEALDGVQNQ
jgi:acyl-CoA thioesterase FadM